MTPIDQRVEQFEKTVRYIIKKLNQTLEQIQNCDDGNSSAIEHMKMTIAPDAALILSQGDTLIQETHGKNSNLTQRLQTIQKELRDKYKDVQNANTISSGYLQKSSMHEVENQYSPKEKVVGDKKFPLDLLQQTTQLQSTASIKLEDLVEKVLKRVKDLVVKPVDFTSEDEITKRILDIGVSLKMFLCDFQNNFPKIFSRIFFAL